MSLFKRFNSTYNENIVLCYQGARRFFLQMSIRRYKMFYCAIWCILLLWASKGHSDVSYPFLFLVFRCRLILFDTFVAILSAQTYKTRTRGNRIRLVQMSYDKYLPNNIAFRHFSMYIYIRNIKLWSNVVYELMVYKSA